MRCFLSFIAITLLVIGIEDVSGQSKPAELPAHLEGKERNVNLASTKTATLTVKSRRPADPASSVNLVRVKGDAMEVFQKMGGSLQPNNSSADLYIDILVEPHIRWGLYHGQNSPYVFLLARKAPNGTVVYCTAQRSGAFTSATSRVLDDLSRSLRGDKSVSDDSLSKCAAWAIATSR